jgi:hypothetical protein
MTYEYNYFGYINYLLLVRIFPVGIFYCLDTASLQILFYEMLIILRAHDMRAVAIELHLDRVPGHVYRKIAQIIIGDLSKVAQARQRIGNIIGS